jgi:mono/diheme cytochrome c family protein
MSMQISKQRLDLKGRLGIFSVVVLLAGLANRPAGAHDMSWIVPPSAKKVKNQVKATPEALAAAADMFHENCAPCHGEKGRGDGEMAQYMKKVKPSNLADAAMMNEMTDGEIFWKISEGRPPMPSWKDALTETQRWQLVSYLRTLATEDLAQKESEHQHEEHAQRGRSTP